MCSCSSQTQACPASTESARSSGSGPQRPPTIRRPGGQVSFQSSLHQSQLKCRLTGTRSTEAKVPTLPRFFKALRSARVNSRPYGSPLPQHLVNRTARTPTSPPTTRSVHGHDGGWSAHNEARHLSRNKFRRQPAQLTGVIIGSGYDRDGRRCRGLRLVRHVPSVVSKVASVNFGRSCSASSRPSRPRPNRRSSVTRIPSVRRPSRPAVALMGTTAHTVLIPPEVYWAG